MTTLLPGVAGFVGLEDGLLRHRTERFTPHGQLPQFHPRTEWPSPDEAAEHQADTSLIDMDIDWEDDNAYGAFRGQVQRRYRALKPMQPYTAETELGVYDGMDWCRNVGIMHNLLHGNLRNNDQGLSAVQMHTLVRILSYGMYDTMTCLYPWHIPRRQSSMYQGVVTRRGTSIEGRHVHLQEAWNPAFGMFMKPCHYHIAGDGSYSASFEGLKTRFWQRRWLVVPIRCGDDQWAMTIFDRQGWQLYIFDCGHGGFERDQADRQERIDGYIHAWTRFWNDMCCPQTFPYFVVPVTGQDDPKESGLLCIMWLIRTLRDQVGRVMSTADEGLERRDIYIGTSLEAFGPATYSDERTALPGVDWRPHGCNTVSTGVAAARRLLRILACNELGLSQHEVMTKRYKHYQSRDITLPSAWMLIQNVVTELQREGSLLGDEFWTASGGPQFAMPPRRPVRPYDDTVDRLWRPSGLFAQRFSIRLHPEELNYRARNVMDWPRGIIFTERCPIFRPPHDISLDLSDIKDNPILHDERSRQYIVNLRDLVAPQAYSFVPHSIAWTIEDAELWHSTEVENGAQQKFVKFQFCVSAGPYSFARRVTWVQPIRGEAHPMSTVQLQPMPGTTVHLPLEVASRSPSTDIIGSS